MLFPLRQTWTKAALILSLGLVSCTQSNSSSQTSPNNPTSRSERPKVVVTTGVLCDMTQQIAAETIDLTCLLPLGADAHVYEPVPKDRQAIETAQLILYSGYNLEPDLIKIIKSTANSAPKIAVGEVAVPDPLLGEEHHHGHEGEEHANEEGEKVPDPHVWQNAQNGSRMVGVIQTNLAQIVPANAKLYTKNAQALREELKQIDRWIKAQIATIPLAHRKIVTTHDTLGYYAAAYNIPVKGALEGLTTVEKPTATQVKSLVDTVKETKVPTIFAETVVNPKLIKTVAKDAKVKVSERELFSDSLGEPGTEGDTYPKMLIANTQTIVEGLGGNFTPFQPKSAEASQK